MENKRNSSITTSISEREKVILSAVAGYYPNIRFETDERGGKSIYLVEDESPRREFHIRYRDDPFFGVTLRGYIHLSEGVVGRNQLRLLELCNKVNGGLVNGNDTYMIATLIESGILLEYRIHPVVLSDLEDLLRHLLMGWMRFFGKESECDLYNHVDAEHRMLDWRVFKSVLDQDRGMVVLKN